jgi:hypothetical protein
MERIAKAINHQNPISQSWHNPARSYPKALDGSSN